MFSHFNNHYVKLVKPGRYLIIDECMSAFEGVSSKFSVTGAPSITKIIRKPRGIGHELKSTACGDSKMIILLELQEGAKLMEHKKFTDKEQSHTAQTLRLVEPWFNTHRIIVGDSAFGSLSTTCALLAVGLNCIMMVKQCKSKYPIDHFSKLDDAKNKRSEDDRGAHSIALTMVQIAGVIWPVYALAWHDWKMKTVIANIGSSLPGNDHVKKRSRIDENNETVHYEKRVKRPKMIEDMFSVFSIIDVHDHLRQGSLAFHSSWHTHSWWVRLFSSVYGIIIVNSYYMYLHYMTKNNPLDTPNTFIQYSDILATQMINNNYLVPNINSRQPKERSIQSTEVIPHEII